MGLQEALHAPRVRTASVPFSFTPHEAYPEPPRFEADLIQTADALRADRYESKEYPSQDNEFGSVGVIVYEPIRNGAGDEHASRRRSPIAGHYVSVIGRKKRMSARSRPPGT